MLRFFFQIHFRLQGIVRTHSEVKVSVVETNATPSAINAKIDIPLIPQISHMGRFDSTQKSSKKVSRIAKIKTQKQYTNPYNECTIIVRLCFK